MKNKLLKIDCICYRVKDLEKAANFYENVLGLQKTWHDKKLHMMGFRFIDSDSEVVIHTDNTIPNYDLSFLVDNVKEFCKEYEMQGHKIIKIKDARCGDYAVLQDPDGNYISIIDLTKFGNKPKYN